MHAAIDKLARFFALLGGLALSAMIILTCLSVAGRSINSLLHSDWMQHSFAELAKTLLATGVGPINGDFELVEAGMAFAIFAFLPLCQLNASHASVSLFTAMLPVKFNRLLITVIEIVFACVLILIAVQLLAGMQSKRSAGQVTFLLEFPIWWAYALSLTGAIVAAVVAVYVAAMRALEVMSGRSILPPDMDIEH